MPHRQARRVATREANHDRKPRNSSGLTRLAREQPLLVVGIGVAVGMALGALLPWNRIDVEFLGEQAEKLKDGALEMASDGYDKVKSVAQTGYDAAAETIGVRKDGSSEIALDASRNGDMYGISRS